MQIMAKQALERERLQAEQRAQESKLTRELVKVEAEERVYSQAMDVNLNPHTENEDLDQDHCSEKKFQYQTKPNSFVAPQRISSQSKKGLTLGMLQLRVM